MYILIDNYDSFTYNLYHYLAAKVGEVKVIRNDACSVEEIKALKPKAILISPGPCDPQDAGICLTLIKKLKKEIPIMGVCLGMQAIGEALGGKIIRSPLPVHGKTDQITHDGQKLLAHIPSPFTVTRYHSLCIDPNSLPHGLIASAYSPDGVIQAVYHEKYPLWGVQFHPESIRTEYGHDIIENFIQLAEDFYV